MKKAASTFLETIITHPEKVLWPKEGYTKLDLLEYYQTIAPMILPHLKNRPIMMHRYPDGIDGKAFYQKEAPDFLPEWIKTVKVAHSDKTLSYIVISDVESLLYVANLGSIEIHSFQSCYPRIDYPICLVIDIDPEDLPFESVIEVALEVHKLFEKLGIKNFCKTSGKRGLHVFVPLAGKYKFEKEEMFSKLLANYLQKSIPDLISLVRDPAKRQKKVYIDYLQNGRTKTMIAPYSLRAIAEATVSTPLAWSEVKAGLDPQDFTIKTVVQRVKRKKDIFLGCLGKGIDMEHALRSLNLVLK